MTRTSTSAREVAGNTRRGFAAERMIAAAAELIAQRGEAGLRVADVARAAGTSTSLIYQTFSDREELVIAAQRARFERAFDESIEEFRSLAAGCTVSDEFRDLALGVVSRSWADSRAGVRAARLSIIGMALTRPALLESVNERHRAQIDDVARIIVDARTRGFLVSDRDPHQLATWVLTSVFGRTLVEMGSDVVTRERWDTIGREAMRRVLFGAPVERACLAAAASSAATIDTRADLDTSTSGADDPALNPRSATAARILDWAIDTIAQRGEAGLRVSDLETEAGISVTSIYLYFGSRDGLVQAAQFARLSTSLDRFLRAWDESIGGLDQARDHADAVRRIVALLTSSEHAAVRRLWLSVLSSTHGRPSLAEAVSERLDRTYRAAAQPLRRAAATGLMLSPLDAEAVVAWLAGMLVARSALELLGPANDLTSWDTWTIDALLDLVGLPVD